MDEQKTVAKGAFWALLSQFAVKFIAFIYLIVIARFLPPETIGLFYLALSVFGILYVFTDLGIIPALNRYVPFFYAKK
jgi:O-antigen/teichoic acid export membrane protein